MIPRTFSERFLYAAKLRCTVTNVGFLVCSTALAAAIPFAIYLVG